MKVQRLVKRFMAKKAAVAAKIGMADIMAEYKKVIENAPVMEKKAGTVSFGLQLSEKEVRAWDLWLRLRILEEAFHMPIGIWSGGNKENDVKEGGRIETPTGLIHNGLHKAMKYIGNKCGHNYLQSIGHTVTTTKPVDLHFDRPPTDKQISDTGIGTVIIKTPDWTELNVTESELKLMGIYDNISVENNRYILDKSKTPKRDIHEDIIRLRGKEGLMGDEGLTFNGDSIEDHIATSKKLEEKLTSELIKVYRMFIEHDMEDRKGGSTSGTNPEGIPSANKKASGFDDYITTLNNVFSSLDVGRVNECDPLGHMPSMTPKDQGTIDNKKKEYEEKVRNWKDYDNYTIKGREHDFEFISNFLLEKNKSKAKKAFDGLKVVVERIGESVDARIEDVSKGNEYRTKAVADKAILDEFNKLMNDEKTKLDDIRHGMKKLHEICEKSDGFLIKDYSDAIKDVRDSTIANLNSPKDDKRITGLLDEANKFLENLGGDKAQTTIENLGVHFVKMYNKTEDRSGLTLHGAIIKWNFIQKRVQGLRKVDEDLLSLWKKAEVGKPVKPYVGIILLEDTVRDMIDEKNLIKESYSKKIERFKENGDLLSTILGKESYDKLVKGFLNEKGSLVFPAIEVKFERTPSGDTDVVNTGSIRVVGLSTAFLDNPEISGRWSLAAKAINGYAKRLTLLNNKIWYSKKTHEESGSLGRNKDLIKESRSIDREAELQIESRSGGHKVHEKDKLAGRHGWLSEYGTGMFRAILNSMKHPLRTVEGLEPEDLLAAILYGVDHRQADEHEVVEIKDKSYIDELRNEINTRIGITKKFMGLVDSSEDKAKTIIDTSLILSNNPPIYGTDVDFSEYQEHMPILVQMFEPIAASIAGYSTATSQEGMLKDMLDLHESVINDVLKRQYKIWEKDNNEGLKILERIDSGKSVPKVTIDSYKTTYGRSKRSIPVRLGKMLREQVAGGKRMLGSDIVAERLMQGESTVKENWTVFALTKVAVRLARSKARGLARRKSETLRKTFSGDGKTGVPLDEQMDRWALDSGPNYSDAKMGSMKDRNDLYAALSDNNTPEAGTVREFLTDLVEKNAGDDPVWVRVMDIIHEISNDNKYHFSRDANKVTYVDDNENIEKEESAPSLIAKIYNSRYKGEDDRPIDGKKVNELMSRKSKGRENISSEDGVDSYKKYIDAIASLGDMDNITVKMVRNGAHRKILNSFEKAGFSINSLMNSRTWTKIIGYFIELTDKDRTDGRPIYYLPGGSGGSFRIVGDKSKENYNMVDLIWTAIGKVKIVHRDLIGKFLDIVIMYGPKNCKGAIEDLFEVAESEDLSRVTNEKHRMALEELIEDGFSIKTKANMGYGLKDVHTALESLRENDALVRERERSIYSVNSFLHIKAANSNFQEVANSWKEKLLCGAMSEEEREHILHKLEFMDVETGDTTDNAESEDTEESSDAGSEDTEESSDAGSEDTEESSDAGSEEDSGGGKIDLSFLEVPKSDRKPFSSKNEELYRKFRIAKDRRLTNHLSESERRSLIKLVNDKLKSELDRNNKKFDWIGIHLGAYTSDSKDEQILSDSESKAKEEGFKEEFDESIQAIIDNLVAGRGEGKSYKERNEKLSGMIKKLTSVKNITSDDGKVALLDHWKVVSPGKREEKEKIRSIREFHDKARSVINMASVYVSESQDAKSSSSFKTRERIVYRALNALERYFDSMNINVDKSQVEIQSAFYQKWDNGYGKLVCDEMVKFGYPNFQFLIGEIENYGQPLYGYIRKDLDMEGPSLASTKTTSSGPDEDLDRYDTPEGQTELLGLLHGSDDRFKLTERVRPDLKMDFLNLLEHFVHNRSMCSNAIKFFDKLIDDKVNTIKTTDKLTPESIIKTKLLVLLESEFFKGFIGKLEGELDTQFTVNYPQLEKKSLCYFGMILFDLWKEKTGEDVFAVKNLPMVVEYTTSEGGKIEINVKELLGKFKRVSMIAPAGIPHALEKEISESLNSTQKLYSKAVLKGKNSEAEKKGETFDGKDLEGFDSDIKARLEKLQKDLKNLENDISGLKLKISGKGGVSTPEEREELKKLENELEIVKNNIMADNVLKSLVGIRIKDQEYESKSAEEKAKTTSADQVQKNIRDLESKKLGLQYTILKTKNMLRRSDEVRLYVTAGPHDSFILKNTESGWVVNAIQDGYLDDIAENPDSYKKIIIRKDNGSIATGEVRLSVVNGLLMCTKSGSKKGVKGDIIPVVDNAIKYTAGLNASEKKSVEDNLRVHEIELSKLEFLLKQADPNKKGIEADTRGCMRAVSLINGLYNSISRVGNLIKNKGLTETEIDDLDTSINKLLNVYKSMSAIIDSLSGSFGWTPSEKGPDNSKVFNEKTVRIIDELNGDVRTFRKEIKKILGKEGPSPKQGREPVPMGAGWEGLTKYFVGSKKKLGDKDRIELAKDEGEGFYRSEHEKLDKLFAMAVSMGLNEKNFEDKRIPGILSTRSLENAERVLGIIEENEYVIPSLLEMTKDFNNDKTDMFRKMRKTWVDNQTEKEEEEKKKVQKIQFTDDEFKRTQGYKDLYEGYIFDVYDQVLVLYKAVTENSASIDEILSEDADNPARLARVYKDLTEKAREVGKSLGVHVSPLYNSKYLDKAVASFEKLRQKDPHELTAKRVVTAAENLIDGFKTKLIMSQAGIVAANKDDLVADGLVVPPEGSGILSEIDFARKKVGMMKNPVDINLDFISEVRSMYNMVSMKDFN